MATTSHSIVWEANFVGYLAEDKIKCKYVTSTGSLPLSTDSNGSLTSNAVNSIYKNKLAYI